MHKSKKKTLVQGLFNSVLTYCLPLFGGCSKMDINRLQFQQNKAARVVLNYPSWSCRETMFNEIQWLSVRQLIVYHTLMTVYNIRKDKSPEILAKKLLRENHNGHIIVPNVQLSLYRSSFSFRGAILWNRLPREIRDENSKQIFKSQLRCWIVKNTQRFDD